MFGWWRTKKMKQATAARGNRVRLFLERLEERDCPSGFQMGLPIGLQTGLQITSFNAIPSQGKSVLLAGTVSDANPSSVNLFFSGAAMGFTSVDSMGRFQFQTQANNLGTIFAFGFDGVGQLGMAQTSIAVPAPTITNLVVVQSGPNRAVTVTGQVPSGAGLTVNLSGIVTATVTVGSDGTFTYSGGASGPGQVSAGVTDVWGQTGTAVAQLTNVAPTITNFEGEDTGYQGIWTFEGQVTDEWAPGETVTFTGLVPLQNITVTVSSTGWFSFQVQLAPSDTGLVVATVTDWYGATGQAQYLV
jgi:hypothetical protein